VCNVDEASAATGNAHSRRVEERAKAEGAGGSARPCAAAQALERLGRLSSAEAAVLTFLQEKLAAKK
jgi:hypothetical protein